MSIKGPLKKELSMENILSLISAYDIYRYYFGDFKINEVTINSLRNDHSPSFIIGNKHGELSHWDFADEKWRGDCFSLVMQKFGVSLYESLKIIDKDFGLGLSTGIITGEYKKITGEYKQPEITRKNTYIQIVTRKFTNEELSYWNAYHQDLADLRDNNIYSIKTLYLNKQRFPLKDTELRFGYFYPNGGYWKIYFPTKEKRKKWISNVPLHTSWGLENINNQQNTLICKSLKDYMVCKKVYPYVVGIQNESLAAFSEDFISFVNNNSKVVFYGGDSDKPGKEASYLITKTLGCKHINPPDNLLNECCKDFADMGKIKGLEVLKSHFISKKLIYL